MRSGHIVVGVDGSPESSDALRWAISEARLRNAEVYAVHAWCVYPPLHPGVPVAAKTWEAVQAEANRMVQDFVAETVGHVPDVPITAAAVHAEGTAAQALVDAASEAELLVVASRGLGGLRGLLLGSVSRYCVQHSRCPVVVVRGTAVADEQPEAEAAAVG